MMTQPVTVLEQEMRVTKRNGELKTVEFDKILRRVKILGKEAGIKINYTALTMKVIDQLFDGISTAKIDELSAEQCASMSSIHHDYNTLAGRIVVSNHHKNTKSSFNAVMTDLYNFTDKLGKNSPLVSDELFKLVKSDVNGDLDKICDYSRDYLIDYFGTKTLERAYLMKIDGKNVERPQHMWLRVAIGIHGEDIVAIKETYDYMSRKYFTHATPTLFNAGTPHPQLSSCFLQAMESDSIDGIYNTLKECALISKWAGGIGLHIHNVRASGSHIRGTNGKSNGIVPMLKVFNNTAKYVDQCVNPETIIYTTDGPKQIQHCSIGETSIYNLKGETEVIQNVLEHPYNGEMLEIDTINSMFPLQITPEHPVFALRNQNKELMYNIYNDDLEKGISEFEWVDAKDLTEYDMLVYPIPKYEADITNISADDCYMYGIILGDGSIDETNASVSLHTTEDGPILQFLERYLTEKIVDYKIARDDKETKITWNRTIHLPFRYNDIYDENKTKRIHKKWLNLPIEKSKFILKGLVDTYKCAGEDIVLNYTSLQLIEAIRFICMKLGLLTSGYVRTDEDVDDKNKSKYCLQIPKTPDICKLFGLDYDDKQVFKFCRYRDNLMSCIRSIKPITYNGILYDLQMKDEHNYLIHNGLVHNGGGRRNGSFAIYLEPWHADVGMFLQMRKNHGDEELKARDLFYAMWIPDLFMERVKANGKWTLMCPDECPGLSDVYGDEFVALYTKYESEGKGRSTVEARDVWFQILDAQMETGTPYILFKDACNKKSNQNNVGTIKSSNLCTEIIEYSDENETAVCNLASIALPTFVDANGVFDYVELHKVAKVVTNNLNRVIDVNYYPTPKTRRSNMRHRPVGIGVSGLNDLFMLLNIPFHSDAAKQVNKHVFETIYHAALEKSCELAQRDGPYETFDGSPASKGILQFDMWNVDPTDARHDWTALKQLIVKHGIRNSLLLAPMPTASTSQILGYNECIEPITSNIYNRRTLAGEFILTNKYLMIDLLKLDLWNEKMKNNIVANNGSVQHIESIPIEIREKYKTVWELPMKHLIDMSADRGAFICQSQSLNLWLEDPNYNTLTSMHFYSWSKGLKTGIYYLRRRARHQAQKFTIEPERRQSADGECEMCGA
jgi:ribonucleoside-diphosphate reductase alpha subunit